MLSNKERKTIKMHSFFLLFVVIFLSLLVYWFMRNYQNVKLFLIDIQTLSYFLSLKNLLLKIVLASMVISFTVLIISTSNIKIQLKLCIFKKHLRIDMFQLKFIFFVLLCINSLVWIAPIKTLYYNSLIFEGTNLYSNYKTVAHAFGATKEGIPYTNSYDAFQYNYSLGHRIFEVDLSMASDGKMVLRHDWDQPIQEGVDSLHIPDSKTFLTYPICGEYTPMTFEDLLLLMRDYPDIYIITDSKSNDIVNVTKEFKSILQSANDLNAVDVLDRLIIQIYNKEMHLAINKIWTFKHYIYTLYQRGFDSTIQDFDSIARYCVNNNIDGITMWYHWWRPEFKELMDKYGIKVYLHSVNDLQEANKYLDDGVTGVYTFFIKPDEINIDNVN